MRGVSQVSPDSLESQASLELRGQSDREEKREVMDFKDRLVQKESEGLLDCQDFQEHRDYRVFQGRRVLQAPEECRDATGQRVRGVTQAAVGSPEHKDCRVHLVFRDQRETPAT